MYLDLDKDTASLYLSISLSLYLSISLSLYLRLSSHDITLHLNYQSPPYYRHATITITINLVGPRLSPILSLCVFLLSLYLLLFCTFLSHSLFTLLLV